MSVPRVVSKEELQLLSETLYTSGGKLFKRGGLEIAKNQKKGGKIFWLGGKQYLVHRVIYYLHYGVWPSYVIDHIDGDNRNNSPENLRDVKQSQNLRSYNKKRKNTTSEYRGVHWYARDSTWHSQIRCEYQRFHVGYFTCEKEAALAWNYKAIDFGFNKEAFNNVF